MRSFSTALLVALFFLSILSEATTRKVPQDFAKIQLAINAAANGDTVLVAEGTYKENLVITKKITLASLFFQDKDTSHISKTIIDGSTPSHPDTGAVISIKVGTDSNTVIAGFTIKGGTGNKHINPSWHPESPTVVGGGIEINSGGATIRNNIITQNHITILAPATDGYGGGIDINDFDFPDSSKFTIIESNIISNNSLAGGTGGNGTAGMDLWNTSARVVGNKILANVCKLTIVGLGGGYSGKKNTYIFERNLVKGNSANFLSGVATGGTGTTATIRNNVITDNIVGTDISPVVWIGDTANAVVEGNYIARNSGLRQNGITLARGATSLIQNNIIVDNSGNGISVNSSTTATIINNTIVNNKRYGISSLGACYVLNNILWNNTVGSFGSGSLFTAYNLIGGGPLGTGDIDANPGFVANDTLYHLSNTSPCIGAGATSTLLGGITVNTPPKDYSGLLRPNPSWSNPDLGAMETSQAFPGGNAIRVPQDYAKIQDAINASVNGDVVLVSEGTYKENLVINKKITLASQFFVDKDTSHISKTILDGSAPVNPDSGSVILVGSSTDSTTVIMGFTITKGTGTKHQTTLYGTGVNGGGIDISSGGASIKNNIITGNHIMVLSSVQTWGGGISVLDNDWPTLNKYTIIESNIISSNSVVGGTSNEAGGIGFWNAEGRIVNNTVSKNTSGVVTAIAAGGEVTNIIIRSNRIIDNYAERYHAGIFLSDACTAVVEQNYISNNLSGGGTLGHLGDAIYLTRNNKLNLITNNIITGHLGKAIALGYNANGTSSAVLINNTIVGNGTALDANASNNSIAYLMNNILWNTNAELSGTVYASYNLIKGGYTGTGNINADPLFVANDSLYRLTPSSPCINKGVNTATVGGILLTAPFSDYFGTARPPTSTPDIGSFEDGTWTGVRELISNHLPTSFNLSQNYPNPFNPSTTIRYALPSSAHVRLTVYDMLGREVETLINEEQLAGWKEVTWNASGFASGMYLMRMAAGSFTETKKILLMK